MPFASGAVMQPITDAFVAATEKRRNPETGASYPWLVRTTRLP